jgi:hypothetical protein
VVLGAIYAATWDDTALQLNSLGAVGWTFSGHTANVNAIAVNGEDQQTIVTASWDGTLRKLTYTGEEVWSVNVGGLLSSVAIDESGNVYTASNANLVYKYDTDGVLVWVFSGHTGNVNSIDVDTSGNVYSASVDNTVRKIDSDGNQVWAFIDSSMKNFNAVAVDAFENVFIGSQNTVVCKLDSDGNELWRFQGHSGGILDISADLAGNVYTTGYDGFVYCLTPAGGEVWGRPIPETGHTISATKDGSVYVGMANGDVVKINAAAVDIWTTNVSVNQVASVISSPAVGAFITFWQA